jgi:putative ABC transport system permease protein
MVISYKFWNRRFNRDPEVIGRRLILNGQLFAIVGVAPDGFHGTGVRSGDGWVPLGMGGVTAMNRAGGWLLLGGRLKPGFEIAQAAAEAEAIGRILQQQHPDDNRDKGLAAQTVSPVPGNTGPVAAFMLMLLAIVLIVLTVACANVAGVLLARAAARRTEIAVRLAIGAGRARLIRQLLTETLLLFALGAGVGVGLARITTTVVASQLPQLPFPIELSPSMDYRAITFTIALAMLAAISSGLIPALQSAKTGMTAALKDDARSPQRLRLRHVFIAAQMAFSILLVAVGLLFVRSLQTAGATDPGFDRQGVELSTVDLSQAGYTDAAGRQFVRTLLERVRSLRGIESASIALVLPGGFETHETGVQVPGLVPPNGDSSFGVDANAIAPGYFSTLHIPLISGRDFTDEDRADTEHVAIIGEGLAHHFWPGQNPIGKYVRQPQSRPNGGSSSPRSIQIVGVVRDVKASSLIDGLAESLFYMPLAQHFSPRVTIVTRASQGRVADEVRATVMQMDANLPVATESLEEYSALGLMPQRIARSLASGLGLVGLLLASIGIYGVTAYSVSSRRREFGIRLALGAPRHNVVRMVLGYGLVLAVVGSVTGLMLAAAAGRILTAFMFGAPPVDALMFSAAAALFIAVGLAACLVPALRASTIDPLQALRCD